MDGGLGWFDSDGTGRRETGSDGGLGAINGQARARGRGEKGEQGRRGRKGKRARSFGGLGARVGSAAGLSFARASEKWVASNHQNIKGEMVGAC